MEGNSPDEVNNTFSDLISVIEEDQANSSMAIHQPGFINESTHASPLRPYVEILEQPAGKETRFRYKCEGRSAGSIPGATSTSDCKTHPKIQVKNCTGKVMVLVSCVTRNSPYRPHPHNLVGRDCKLGVCTVEVTSEDMTVTFTNLGIQCVKRKDIEEALRTREKIRVDPFRTGFSHASQPSNIDLNTVRLCFQAFVKDPVSERMIPLDPVVSDPIHDKKAVQDLKICNLSQCSGSASGGTDVILLCEKVVKEDISVRFYEEREDQGTVWEGYADFTPSQVHKQYAISFKTPKYLTLQIDQPVKVLVELRRPSDGAVSEPRQFTIYPVESGTPPFWSIRRSLFSKNHSLFSNLIEPVKPIEVEVKEPEIPAEQTVEEEIVEQVVEESPEEVIIIDEGDSNKEGMDDFLEEVKDFGEMLPPEEVDDTCLEVYTSMQMAMKNPMDMEGYEDMVPPRPTAAKPQNFRRAESDLDLPAPPLPPKRAKKSNQRNLPPIPEKTKLNIFQKLFCSAKRKKAKSLAGSVGSKGSVKSINSEVITSKGMDLTEAEHYALYDTFAPKATLSECDDMSFYYSTVEGQNVKTNVQV